MQLNKFVNYRRFKMETIKSAVKLIRKEADMATVDLQDTYSITYPSIKSAE